MCLAKAYVRPVGAVTNGGNGGTNGTVLLMENVTNVVVEGDQLRLKSLLGASETLHGRIASIDFSEGKLILQSVEA
jgi:predicted RNA-binding protein